MREQADYLVIGSSTFSRLLAGLLRSRHGSTVLYCGEPYSPFRPPHPLDLSVAPITRPETWALLQGGMRDFLDLIGHIGGRKAWRYVNPIFCAGAYHEIEALGHIRHMAQAFGGAAEPVPRSRLPEAYEGWLLREAIWLNPDMLEPALETWLSRAGVIRTTPDDIRIGDDGSAELTAGAEKIYARQTILADAKAISVLAPWKQWPTLLHRRSATSLQLAEAARLSAPVLLDLGSGTTLWQRAEDRVSAIALHDHPRAAETVQALLGSRGPLPIVGQARLADLVTTDGAPAVGRLGGTGVDIVAGFGALEAFFAPALARWICGQVSQREADWFGARLVSRSAGAPGVAEFASGGGA